MAARCPPGPEPITTRSYGCIRGVLLFQFGHFRGVDCGGGWSTVGVRELRLPLFQLCRAMRIVMIYSHQMTLSGETVLATLAVKMSIQAVRPQLLRLSIIGQIGRQNFLADT